VVNQVYYTLKHVAAAAIATFIISAPLFAYLSWQIAQPAADTIQLEEATIPADIYPTPFKGWHITVSYGNPDTYQATKGDTIVEANSLYELAQKINATTEGR
jgi:hypothetical protein